ncbi:hypothetical protein BH24CHL9_BH24CHL9_03360 [soil metagenome]
MSAGGEGLRITVGGLPEVVVETGPAGSDAPEGASATSPRDPEVRPVPATP